MKILAAICLVFGVSIGFSQNKQQLYGVDYLPQSLLLNPGGTANYDKHFGIPLLSGFSMEAGTTGVTVYDIFKNDGGNINNRIIGAISDLSRKDYFTVNEQLEIISVGWRTKKGDYISGGWYQETDAIIYFPKDLAVLAYEGNANYINQPFDFSDVTGRGEVLSVFHIGINHPVSGKLKVGVRAKLYSSIFSFQSLNNTGQFLTTLTPEGENIYNHRVIQADTRLQTVGTNGFKGISGAQLAKNAVFSGNMGVGGDIGFTYRLNKNWQVSGSLLDVGFIYNRAKIRDYYFKGDYSLNGIGFIFPPVLEDDEFNPYFDDIREDFETQLLYGDEVGSGFISWRPVKLYGSLDYGYGRGEDCNCLHPEEELLKNHIGIQVFAIKRPLSPQAEITAYFDTALTNFLRSKFTYTVDRYSATNLGFLMSAQLNKLNLYIALDNLLGYSNIAKSKNASIQLGMQLVIKNK